MDKLIKIAQNSCSPEVFKPAEFFPGDIINVHIIIKEKGKERIQQFQGTIIKIQGHKGRCRTVTVRKVKNEIGVERIFVVPSPHIAKIELKRKAIRVRRANLSYLRTSKKKVKYKV